MKLKTAAYGIGALALSGLLAIAVPSILEDLRYTEVVVQDELYTSIGGRNAYIILTTDGRIIGRTSSATEKFQDLEMQIKQGTKIKFIKEKKNI